jgi:hypothetical protein
MATSAAQPARPPASAPVKESSFFILFLLFSYQLFTKSLNSKTPLFQSNPAKRHLSPALVSGTEIE